MSDWALITGATTGIGLELARIFARERHNLVLTARNEARLQEVAADLRRANEIETRVVAKDLSTASAPQELFDATSDLTISTLVNNAGLGFYGDFADVPLDRHRLVMQVNMTALVELTYLFLAPMLRRGQGRILNVASMAAFQPGPTINVYYASKAFAFSFTYSLAMEVEDRGITVTALCPGTTHTEFFERGGFGPVRAPLTMSARAVAEAGYRGLMRGKRLVIPGWHNRLAVQFARRMPLSVTSAVVKKLHRKRRVNGSK
ncbi:MAG TPA: SDR family oxidoreductase [Verrucomicrobia bacterium]|nr:SDR family oxidoreductase [Verrucomicrobiota bacterium]HOB31975.1 SDR family oxidoreductase [Verrucomicrobiota bacterium]HOP97439.1 SDR family oxidoreductase [Verrucomicrobiota bacterium]HPU54698.1 SDR family oxidoreductase [Verrucomicrobiota bacterium]